MAGKPGKSGGARSGAGRKRKATMVAAVETSLEPQPRGGALKRSKAVPVQINQMDMLEMLQAVALGHVEATTTQVRAAIAAVQYTHTKRGEGGKKEAAAGAAKTAASGKFGPRQPPRLVSSK